MELVDLTQPLVSGMPTFPGDPEVTVEPALDLARHGCAVASLRLGSHSGTHVDAPSHVVPGGATLDELDLGLFTGPAVVVDVRGRAGWEPFAEHTRRFGPGVVVLVRTGWEERWGAPDHADHPPLEVAVVQRLLDAGVRTLGVDALSPDATGDPDLPVHRAVLGAGGVLVENLRGLARVAAMRAPQFCALPLRVSGGDGSPVRAVAWETRPPSSSPAWTSG